MKYLTNSSLLAAWMPARVQPGRWSLTVVVKGSYRITHEGGTEPLPLKDRMFPIGDTRKDKGGPLVYASDFAPFKPRADILLKGTAKAPAAKPVPALKAGLQVGDWVKVLDVFGDRYWVGEGKSRFSDPVPFTEMPLAWENAFGAPDYRMNPFGKGIAAAADASGRIFYPLPNIVDPQHPIRHSEDRPAPAGFGPIDMIWPQRLPRTGTYDSAWLKEYWPGYPADFDWSSCNAAPADQRISGYLKGDETIEAMHLDADVPYFRSALPGIRPRALLRDMVADESGRYPNNAAGTCREVPLRLDTLWLDMDEKALVLVWRGLAEVRSRDFKEVSHLFVAEEPLAHEPAPAESHVAAFQALLAAERRKTARAVIAEEKAAAAAAPAPAAPEPVVEAQPKPDPMPPEMRAEMEKLAKDGREKLAKAGLPPEVVALFDPEGDMDAFTAKVNEHLGITPKKAAEAMKKAQDKTKADFVKAGVDPALVEQMFAEPEPKPAPAAEPEPEEPPLDGRRVAAGVAAGESFADADLSGLDFIGLDLSGGDFKNALFDGARLDRAILRQADLSGAVLGGASAAEADFSGAKAAGAIFTKAKLAGARFTGADLKTARFDQADLSATAFAGVAAPGAIFRQARLAATDFSDAVLDKADFQGATLDGARFPRVSMAKATLDDVTGTADFSGADMTGVRAGRGVSLRRSTFRSVKAEKSCFIGADLRECDFAYADLAQSNFSEAVLAGAHLEAADLTKADLTLAQLGKARIVLANLFQARLERADLRLADLRGANCFQAEFWDARVLGADFTGANIKRTKLVHPDFDFEGVS